MIMILVLIAVRREAVVAPIVAGTAWVPDLEIRAIAIDVATINREEAMILMKTSIAAVATATVINFKADGDRTAQWEITRN